MGPKMSGRRLSATEVFIDAVEGLCLHEAKLEDVTEAAAALHDASALAAMAAWGERWLIGPEGTPLVLHHTECEHDMHAVVVCSECAQPLDVRHVRAKTGPGYPG